MIHTLKNKSTLEKVLLAALAVLNVLFLVYWALLSANYCLHFDDVHFMWKLRDNSIAEYVREMYMTRGGNFVGYGINGIVFKIANWVGDYHLWPMVIYALGIAMVSAAAKPLQKHIGRTELLLGVMALYNIYVLTAPDYAIYTWLCAMAYYLYAPAICLLIRYINEQKLCWWQWAVLVVLVLFLAGSNVVITPMALLVMLVNGLIIWRKNSWGIAPTWQTPAVKRLIFIALAMLAILAVVVAAPGNYNRLELGDDMHHPETIVQFGTAWIKCMVMFCYMMAFYLPYQLLALTLGYSVGAKANKAIPTTKAKAILLIVSAFALYLAITTLPLAYLFGGFSVQRNYTHPAFFGMLMFVAVGYVLGNGQTAHVRMTNIASIALSVMLIVIMCCNLYQDIPVAKAYRLSHEERMAYLQRLQSEGNTEQVMVPAYPSTNTPDAKYNVMRLVGKTTPGQAIYYEADTDVEPNEYEGHMRKLYHIDFDFVQEDAEECIENTEE